MEIKLESGTYKSISDFHWKDVPKFAVVTGSNGSGKTQLLELIAGALGLFPPPEGFRGRDHGRGPFNARVVANPKILPTDVVFLRSEDWREQGESAELKAIVELAEEVWSSRTARVPGRSWNRLWAIIEKNSGLSREAISREKFVATLPPNFVLLSDGEFPVASIAQLFVSYMHIIDMEVRQSGISREQAAEGLSPLPWTVLNEILVAAGLNYTVAKPSYPQSLRFANETLRYNFALVDKSSGETVAASELSSGEKVMLRIALWFFVFSQRNAKGNSQTSEQLLLLDEPDAHLHPALTKAFLRVVKTELVDRHGLRVIMTSHSPSTVALADDDCVFVMNRDSPRIVKAKSRWDAMTSLTSGFVTVGSNAKCVFVEGEWDRKFFHAVQVILRDSAVSVNCGPQTSITFVAAGTARVGSGEGEPSGGVNNVRKWVQSLESTQVAGIIDGDNGNAESSRIYVLRRYSLESYLFDPLFLFALVLEDGKAPEVKGFKAGIRDARRLDQRSTAELQEAVDVMTIEIAKAVKFEAGTDELISVEYAIGHCLNLKTWLFTAPMKKYFQPLRERFGVHLSHEDLIRRYESLAIVPMELLSMLKRIQSS